MNHLDATDRSALMYASTGPYADTVKVLLEAGAKVNLIDNQEGFTALMFAAAEGQSEIVTLLLDASADPSLADVDGDTASSFAAKNGHTAVVELIAQHVKPTTGEDVSDEASDEGDSVEQPVDADDS